MAIICAWCKKLMRITDNDAVTESHGICPDCFDKVVTNYA